MIHVRLVEGRALERLQRGDVLLAAGLQRLARVVVLGRDLELRDEGNGLLVDPGMVGDHQLRELLHFGVLRRRRREPARVHVDLVGGDDDRRDLRVVDALGVDAGRQQQRPGDDDGGNLHALSL